MVQKNNFLVQIQIGNKNRKKSKNLDYRIAVTFRNINRFLVLSLKNGNDDPTRDSFDNIICH